MNVCAHITTCLTVCVLYLNQVSEFKDQLLSSAGVSPERIIEFSCGEFVWKVCDLLNIAGLITCRSCDPTQPSPPTVSV